MEIVINPPVTDRLRDLSSNPLFWFLKDADFEHLQHDTKSEKYGFGSVYAETLGSGAAGKLNEDSFSELPMGEGRTFFAVFDGASSQKEIKGLSSVEISGAFYISHLASLGFRTTSEYAELCQKPELSAKDIMIVMNKWIQKKLEDVEGIDYSDIPSVPGMAAAFMLVDMPNKRLTIAQVADATIALVKKDGRTKILTPNLNEKFDQETMTYIASLAKEYGSDMPHIRQIPEAKVLINAHLAESFTRKTNKVGGCGIMNGMPEMDSNGLIYSDTLPMSNDISSILLFSDGAVLPFTRKEVSLETAVESMVDVLDTRNGSSVLTLGATILENDPDFVKIPRMKLKDDATVIEASFSRK